MDEKSQIQALGRTQPLLPMRPGQIERFFALLTQRQLRRGVHRSVGELHTAITAFIDANNAKPKPFRWTKTADDIRASVERCCLLNEVKPASNVRTSEPGH